jgi:mannose-1-phosphate guanylyltransferase
VKAIVLVGGEGTRLRPLTYTTPKQMLAVVEVPMIERVVGHLVAHGVTDVVLSLGYRPDAFTAAYPDGRCAGAHLSYAVEPELLDTAGAIRFAACHGGVDQTFLVLNGDVLTDVDIAALIAFHRQRGGEGTIALTPVEDPSSFGVVACDEDGRVRAFIEKPAPGTAPTNLINAGIYVLEPAVLDRIAADRRVNIEREIFPSMVADAVLNARPSDRYWLDVGTPERYIQASIDLLNGRRVGPPTPDASEVTRTVWRQGDAAVSGAITGPCFVGARASVDAGAAVHASVVGSGVSIGAGAVVEGSVLLSGSVVERGAEVRDAVIGERAVIAEGASVTGWSVVGADALVDVSSRLVGARHPTD